MLVHPSSSPDFVVSVCGVQVSSFTDRSVQGRSLATEKKYVSIIKEMGKISKALVTFYGTLNLTELSRGAWLVCKKQEMAQLQTSPRSNAC